MTLTMDPGSRNALVGKIVPQGQAYRAVRCDRRFSVGGGLFIVNDAFFGGKDGNHTKYARGDRAPCIRCPLRLEAQ